MKYMSRALLSAVVLLAAGSGVGVYAYYGAYKGSVESEAKRDLESHLFQIDPGQVIGGEVTQKDQPPIRFARTRSGWVITQPVDAPGDREVLDALMLAMVDLRADSRLDSKDKNDKNDKEADLAARYGFDHPKVTLTLDIFGGTKATLIVGAKNDFDGRWYIENAGEKTIGLATPEFLKEVDRDLYALRDKHLLFFDQPEVLGIEVQKKGTALFRIEKKGEAFILTAPEAKSADRIEVVRLIEELKDLRAQSFVDDSGTGDASFLSKYGLEVPEYIVGFRLSGDRALQLRIGGARDAELQQLHWYARVDGTKPLAEIHATFYRNLDRPAIDFEDRQILLFAPEKVARVRIERAGSEAIEVVKGTGDTWELEKPKRAKARTYKVSALLYALSNLRAQKFDTGKATGEDLKRAGLVPAATAIMLKAIDGSEVAGLLVGKEANEAEATLYAMKKGAKRIDIVDAQQLAAVPKSAGELEDASK